MRAINQQAAKVLQALTDGLEIGDARKVGSRSAFMDSHVDRLTEDLFSVAHYYEQNGDSVADPDMEFWRGADAKLYPVAIQQPYSYARAVEFGDKDQPTGVNHARQREMAVFAGQWMKNIRDQQRWWFEGGRKAGQGGE